MAYSAFNKNESYFLKYSFLNLFFIICIVATNLLWAADMTIVQESIEIQASPEKVWRVIQNFSNLKWMAKDPIEIKVTCKPKTLSCERIVTGGNGVELTEVLLKYQAPQKRYSYSIRRMVKATPNGAFEMPLSSFESTLEVHAKGKSASEVQWKAQFKLLPYSQNQKLEQIQIIKLIETTSKQTYKAALKNLKELVENKVQP
jgi:hypothetical protein